MTWFKVQAKSAKSATLQIYAEIGSDWFASQSSEDSLTAKQFIDAVDALGPVDHIELRVNSPGGDVFGGFAIYNYLKAHQAKITAHIDGLAASIASVIVMAADRIIMPANAGVMIHMPTSIGFGDAEDLRELATLLDSLTESIVAVYASRTGLAPSAVRELVKDETYLFGDEAKKLGFADEVLPAVQAAAHADPQAVRTNLRISALTSELRLKNEAIQKLEARLADSTPSPADAMAVVDLCQQHGVSAHAAALIKAKLPLQQVKSRVALMQDVQDLMITAGLEMGNILDHVDDPMQMMRIAVVNACAERSPKISSLIGKAHTGSNDLGELHKKVYAQRNAQRG